MNFIQFYKREMVYIAMCGQPTDMGCCEDGELSFAGEIQTI